MSMLSSVAERLFWMARYLERAEETARLANAYTQFILDTPEGNEPGWRSLVDILDAEQPVVRTSREDFGRRLVAAVIEEAPGVGTPVVFTPSGLAEPSLRQDRPWIRRRYTTVE